MLNKKNYLLRTLYPEKKIAFSDEGKASEREFVTSRHILKECLKEVLEKETKEGTSAGKEERS